MTIEADVFTALNSVMAFGGRAYPLIFPRSPTVPVTPAVRYTIIGGQNDPDICGAGPAETDNIRIQIDIVSVDYKVCRSLRLLVITAMESMTTPTLRDGPGFDDFDSELKLYKHTIDFLTYPSTV